jgi:DNA-binding Xre family transcriptional regulator
MVNVDKLRGLMAERGLTKTATAQILGMTPATLNRKFKIGVFRSDEMEKLIQVLHIENPDDVFFARNVT